MLAALSHGDFGLVLLLLAVAAFGAAVWRAVLRDVLGAILCAVVGIIILLVAF